MEEFSKGYEAFCWNSLDREDEKNLLRRNRRTPRKRCPFCDPPPPGPRPPYGPPPPDPRPPYGPPPPGPRPPYGPPPPGSRPPYGSPPPGPRPPYGSPPPDIRPPKNFRVQENVENEKDSLEIIRRENEYMKEYHPYEVKKVRFVVEEICNRVDYPESFIYDSYPERDRIYQLVEEAYQELIRQMDEETKKKWKKEEDNTLEEFPMNLSSEWRGLEESDPICIKNLVYVLFLQEIFYRRQKHFLQ